MIRKWIGSTCIVVMLLVVFSAPFIWMLISSLTDNKDLFLSNEMWSLLPERWAWENYVEVFQRIPLLRYLMNSFVIAVMHSVLETLLAAMAAYTMIIVGGRIGRLLFVLLYMAWLIPGTFLVLPRFLVTVFMPYAFPASEFWTEPRIWDVFGQQVNVGGIIGLDSFFALIVPGCFSATAAFLLAAAIRQLPQNLFEMALLDTGSQRLAFRDACLPSIKAPLAVVAFLAFHGSWQSFTWPLLMASSPDMLTAPIGLMTFRDLHQAQWSLVMAGGVILTLPSVLLLFFAHRYVIDRAEVHDNAVVAL